MKFHGKSGWIFGALVLFCCSVLNGGDNFGYVKVSFSGNIGDFIQSIAAKRFLPQDSIAVDRESMGLLNCGSKINTIMNAWYMNGKSWPPSVWISPLLISMHFTQSFIPIALSNEGIAYLKLHGPVGARDYYTLKALREKGIPCYFSGCLTLTLENSHKKRDDVIYAVDIDDECVKFIKSKTGHKVEVLTHIISSQAGFDDEERFECAEKILEKYRKAKCVVTSRLHAAMPCLAFKTPVLLINTQVDQYRFEGLNELVRNCSKEEFLAGLVRFNFNEPSENSDLYVPIRENLIKTVTNWVNSRLK